MSIFDFTREPISITKPIRLIELFAGYGSQAMTHYKPIKCVVCSKIFTPTAANQNTCCEAHRQQRAAELRKIREKKRLKRKPVKKNKLAEICEIAKSKGMSYGQYMAEQYKKEVMIK